MCNHQSLPGNLAVKYEFTWVYNWKCQVEKICVDDKTVVSPSVLIQKTCFWACFDWNVQPDPLPTKYLVPWEYYHFPVYKMDPNIMQVSYVSGQTCTFTTSTLKKIIWPDVHFQSQFNAPPEFPIGSKISGHWLDIHFHAPIYVAKATESISPECF